MTSTAISPTVTTGRRVAGGDDTWTGITVRSRPWATSAVLPVLHACAMAAAYVSEGRVLGVCVMGDGRARQPHDRDDGGQGEANDLRSGRQRVGPEPGS